MSTPYPHDERKQTAKRYPAWGPAQNGTCLCLYNSAAVSCSHCEAFLRRASEFPSRIQGRAMPINWSRVAEN